jgi:hypothetical protein
MRPANTPFAPRLKAMVLVLRGLLSALNAFREVAMQRCHVSTGV